MLLCVRRASTKRARARPQVAHIKPLLPMRFAAALWDQVLLCASRAASLAS